MTRKKQEPPKFGDALESCIGDAYNFAQDRICTDQDAREVREQDETARAELRRFRDMQLILEALGDGRAMLGFHRPRPTIHLRAGGTAGILGDLLDDATRKLLGET